MIPAVVCNALLNSGNTLNFIDDVDWIGDSYILHEFENYKIIDSAQKVDHNQFIKEANDEDLMVFSFYPTKPISSCDGGIIVSNDQDKINWFKEAVMNGMSYSANNWERKIKFPGFKMYMNSVQCYIANENLKNLNDKKKKLLFVREQYNRAFNLSNTSDHLYRILVNNRDSFIQSMKSKGIVCGIHYEALHTLDVYKTSASTDDILKNSLEHSSKTVSLPFHEKLTQEEIDYVINQTKKLL
jgi:dTDP-4-amino-4,6-dideoxygalactose transaminase